MKTNFAYVIGLPSLVLAAAVAGCATEKGEGEKSAEVTKVAETAKRPAAKPRNAGERLRAFLRDEVNAPAKKLGTASSSVLPLVSTFSRNAPATSLLKIPFSSNAENASASSTSAHLYE